MMPQAHLNPDRADAPQIVLQFDRAGTDDAVAADLTHRYLWGPRVDEILADEQISSPSTPGETLWTLTDYLGTVRDLAEYDEQTDQTTIANHRVYDAFGRPTSETKAAVDCVFGYTGNLFGKATGLQNSRRRWYDADTGRWASQQWHPAMSPRVSGVEWTERVKR